MLLSPDEAKLFFKLHWALMQFVMEQTRSADVPRFNPEPSYLSLPPEKQHHVVQTFLGRRDLIDTFIAANPAKLSEEELEIVSSWRHLVTGKFIALRQFKEFMVLLSCEGKSAAYGVTGLSQPIEQVIPHGVPAMVEMVLLPFRGRIIYDGTIRAFNVTFGPGSRRSFEESFRTAKAIKGIVKSLPCETPVKQAGATTPKPQPTRRSERKRTTAKEVLQQVVAITDEFCQRRLNEEYLELCRTLAQKLANKRPSPLVRGQTRTWACGILRTIGWVNFLDDGSQSPHMKLPEIDRELDVAESTGQAKALAIRRLVKIHQFDHRWILPSRWETSPMIWTLRDPNGFLIDIRNQPVAMQRAAFKQGLIPYVPADRAASAVQERIGASTSRRLFQFKITLRGVTPPIWRRIQVYDDTLDKLHEHIQAAMGWTNSHLHDFMIEGRHVGDPELLDDVETFDGMDSTRTLISELLPPDRAPIPFVYQYDFGDSWEHDVQFEGSPEPQPGKTYPLCLEGERACPPEDVGGIHGYAEYLEAIADPNHERHQQILNWHGPFKPEAFNARLATHVMQEGVPKWRKMG